MKSIGPPLAAGRLRLAVLLIASLTGWSVHGGNAPELVRAALTVVNSKDSVERQLARLKVNSPELLRALARDEKDIGVRRTAILLLTDQAELKRLAVVPQALIREVAVLGIDDEAFLVARVRARDESSPTVRAAIVGALRTEAAMAEAARTAYYGEVRNAAASAPTDPALITQVGAAQEAIPAQVRAAAGDGASTSLVEQALHASFHVVCQAAAGRLQSQDDLAAVALATTDRDVLKLVLARLAEPALLHKVSVGAADTPMRLAAAAKAGSRAWENIFTEATRQDRAATALGDALAAVSLYQTVQPAASAAVQQACIAMIRQGDESRIPEMSDLITLYGDKPLAEDCLNCGQPDLNTVGRRWAGARGLNVGTGSGSNRANWGSNR